MTFVIHSECKAGMAAHIAVASIDAIVTDPPYGLSKQPDMREVLGHWLAGDDYDHKSTGFMGKSWDSFVPGPSIWAEAFRCLKPGGHALVFAGSRTQDLMSLSLRLAGFEIRDCVMWLYGSGFPKSLNVKKATGSPEWEGYGTALKPAYEPIIIARKPLEGTVANNVLVHGTGGLNIDGCRVGASGGTRDTPNGEGNKTNEVYGTFAACNTQKVKGLGRWPANVMHDGLSEEWARYFYCAKTSKTDRNAGLDNFVHTSAGDCVNRKEGSAGVQSPSAGAGRTSGSKNSHPTVKPTELMRYLCRLVGGHRGSVIMDPFSGSGSTGRGAILEGFGFIGFEMDKKYCEIANARILDTLSIT